MNQTIVGSLCWIFANNSVLMLKRNKFPHQGLWAALGGKIEAGESPLECVIREVREESGLNIKYPDLRGIVSVYNQTTSQHWILFIYVASAHQGVLGKTTEGELAWMPIPIPANLLMAKTDRMYLNESINTRSGIFQAKIIYDESSLFDVALTYPSEKTRGEIIKIDKTALDNRVNDKCP